MNLLPDIQNAFKLDNNHSNKIEVKSEKQSLNKTCLINKEKWFTGNKNLDCNPLKNFIEPKDNVNILLISA